MKVIVSLGRAVKMLSTKTDVIMISFEEARNRLPKANKIVLTGNPTRKLKKVLNLSEKIALKERFGLNPAKPVILVFGGSQGAKVINDAIMEMAKLKLNKNYQILLAARWKTI